MAKTATKIHKEIQKEDNFGNVDRQQKFLQYDAVGFRGDANAGVAGDKGNAYIESVQKYQNKKPLPVKGVGLS